MNTFRSEIYSAMNPFLRRLEEALGKLPNHPNPKTTGFYLAHIHTDTKILSAEKIGTILEENEYLYLNLAAKKVTETLRFGKKRSAEFADEKIGRYPGAVSHLGYCAGVAGHDDPLIDEAIALLWILAYELHCQSTYPNPMEDEIFWTCMIVRAKTYQKCEHLENPWIDTIAILLM